MFTNVDEILSVVMEAKGKKMLGIKIVEDVEIVLCFEDNLNISITPNKDKFNNPILHAKFST